MAWLHLILKIKTKSILAIVWEPFPAAHMTAVLPSLSGVSFTVGNLSIAVRHSICSFCVYIDHTLLVYEGNANCRLAAVATESANKLCTYAVTHRVMERRCTIVIRDDSINLVLKKYSCDVLES